MMNAAPEEGRDALANMLMPIGPGKSKAYLRYRWLTCGHEAEYVISHVKSGVATCRECKTIKLKEEARSAGLEILGLGKDSHRRFYRFIACGHEAEFQMQQVRLGHVRCRTCLNEKHRTEASSIGLEFLGDGQSPLYRKYRWINCGHIAEYQHTQVRNSTVACKECLNARLSVEAAEHGLEMIGAGSAKDTSKGVRRYRWLSCGHEEEHQIGNVRNGRVWCQQCADERLRAEAAAAGLELVGRGKNKDYRRYRWLDCGHEEEYQVVQIRTSYCRCNTCVSSSWTLPTYIYLFRIINADQEWLKLGYAVNLKGRINSYNLPIAANVELLDSVLVETGRRASEIEKALHKKHRKIRLAPTEMREHHRDSGYSECYPIGYEAVLRAELAAIRDQQRSLSPETVSHSDSLSSSP